MTRQEYLPPVRPLAALRIIRGLTQEEVADFLFLSPSTYSRKERGELLFNTREVNVLLDIFRVPYEKVFKIKKK
ncbi:helix-turn-helix transcriptional regulator [Treponema sp. R6D11]